MNQMTAVLFNWGKPKQAPHKRLEYDVSLYAVHVHHSYLYVYKNYYHMFFNDKYDKYGATCTSINF